MDTDRELARAKWLFLGGLMFLMSCFACYVDLVYLLKGRDTQAVVTDVYEVTQRGRFGQDRGTNLTVEYKFTEPDGTNRTGSATVATDWQLPRTGTVSVRYTPGAEGRSRLSGHVNWIGIGIFAIAVGVVGFFVYRLLREASEDPRPTKSRLKGRKKEG